MYGRNAKRAALWCAITRRDLLDNTSTSRIVIQLWWVAFWAPTSRRAYAIHGRRESNSILCSHYEPYSSEDLNIIGSSSHKNASGLLELLGSHSATRFRRSGFECFGYSDLRRDGTNGKHYRNILQRMLIIVCVWLGCGQLGLMRLSTKSPQLIRKIYSISIKEGTFASRETLCRLCVVSSTVDRWKTWATSVILSLAAPPPSRQNWRLFKIWRTHDVDDPFPFLGRRLGDFSCYRVVWTHHACRRNHTPCKEHSVEYGHCVIYPYEDFWGSGTLTFSRRNWPV
jgi:hypothetical protein